MTGAIIVTKDTPNADGKCGFTMRLIAIHRNAGSYLAGAALAKQLCLEDPSISTHHMPESCVDAWLRACCFDPEKAEQAALKNALPRKGE